MKILLNFILMALEIVVFGFMLAVLLWVIAIVSGDTLVHGFLVTWIWTSIVYIFSEGLRSMFISNKKIMEGL